MTIFISGCGYYFPNPSLPFNLLHSQFGMLLPFCNNHTLMIVSSYVIVFYRIQTISVLDVGAVSVWVSHVRYPELYRTSCIHIIRFHTGLATPTNLSHFCRSHYLSPVPLIYIRVYCHCFTYQYSHLTQDNANLHVCQFRRLICVRYILGCPFTFILGIPLIT